MNCKELSKIRLLLVSVLIVCLIGLTGCASQPAAEPPSSQGDSATVSVESTDLDGFPPEIPHILEGRDQCIVCHREGEVGNAPKTPHPELTNCRQCHVLVEGI